MGVANSARNSDRYRKALLSIDASPWSLRWPEVLNSGPPEVCRNILPLLNTITSPTLVSTPVSYEGSIYTKFTVLLGPATPLRPVYPSSLNILSLFVKYYNVVNNVCRPTWHFCKVFSQTKIENQHFHTASIPFCSILKLYSIDSMTTNSIFIQVLHTFNIHQRPLSVLLKNGFLKCYTKSN